MIYCSNCGAANPAGSRFCNQCASNLQNSDRRCGVCGALNPAGKSACMNCGMPLPDAVSALPEQPPAAEPPTAARATDADMPAWLRELRAASQAAPPEAFAEAPETDADVLPTPEDEIPDWLRALRVQPAETPPREPPALEPPASSVPAETAAAQTLPAKAEAEPPAELPASAEATLSAEVETEEEPHAEALAESDVPDWLHNLQPEEFKLITNEDEKPQAAGASGTEPAREGGTMPNWLRQLRESEAPTAAEPTASEAAAPELPAWLAELSDKPTPAPSAPAPAEAPAAPSAETPDWVKSLEPAATPPGDTTLSDVAVEELPDWLKPAAAPAPAAESAGGLAPGEIPAWLEALKPGAAPAPGSEFIEASGLLAGIRGALPVESALTAPHRRQSATPSTPQAPVEGFAELFTPQPTPPGPAVEPVQPPARRSGCAPRLLLSLAIVLAVIVAFLPLPLLADLRGVNITGRQPTLDFYQTINQTGSLRQGALALVGVDYGAGTRSELDPQARAAILHLFQNKQRILAVSFVPDGAQIAQELLSSASPASTGYDYAYRYGTTHVNGGFVPGGEAGMRQLAQGILPAADFARTPLETLPLARGLSLPGAVELIVIFTDDGTQLRRWLEQVGRGGDKPVIAGVSAAAAPIAAPYYDSGQLKGYLAGQRGAAEYEGYLGRPASASATLDAVSYVVIVLALAIVGVLVARLLGQPRGMGRGGRGF